jgi:hypothetical protein
MAAEADKIFNLSLTKKSYVFSFPSCCWWLSFKNIDYVLSSQAFSFLIQGKFQPPQASSLLIQKKLEPPQA